MKRLLEMVAAVAAFCSGVLGVGTAIIGAGLVIGLFIAAVLAPILWLIRWLYQ